MFRASVLPIVFGVLLLVGTPAGAGAAPGDLDTSFGLGGTVFTEFYPARDDSEGANDLALQRDGKIVVVGEANRSPGDVNGLFALVRYNADGTLDHSFSRDGKVQTRFHGDALTTAVAIQPDGKIVAVGEVEGSGSGDFALARYNRNGSLDRSFSGDGKQVTNLLRSRSEGDSDDGASGVALQRDGRIVVAGSSNPPSSTGPYFEFALARYRRDGRLDRSFSGDGWLTTRFGRRIDRSDAYSVAILPSGNIVAAGSWHREEPGVDHFAVASYRPDGALNRRFSTDGKQATSFGGGDSSSAYAVAAQCDGKVVLAGSAKGGFALARYGSHGRLDRSFAGDGKETTSFSGAGYEGARGVAIQADGDIVAGGGADLPSRAHFGSNSALAVARYKPDGRLDPAFATDGKQITPAHNPRLPPGLLEDDFGDAVALQADGKIVLAGTSEPDDFGSMAFVTARYQGDGAAGRPLKCHAIHRGLVLRVTFRKARDRAGRLCARNRGIRASVRGAKTSQIRRAAFRFGRRPLLLDRRRPFSRFVDKARHLGPSHRHRISATVLMKDGKRVTLRRLIRVCAGG
jgi:uncharacterized delta-60 repeat protein